MLVESTTFGLKEFELPFKSKSGMVLTSYRSYANFWQLNFMKMLHPIWIIQKQGWGGGLCWSPSLLNPNPNVNSSYGWVYIELGLKTKDLQIKSIISVDREMFDPGSLN